MSEDKMVSRNVAIALGIICIISIAVIAYLSASIISEHNNSSYFNSYVLTHGHSNADYDALQNQVNDLNDIVNLTKSTGWVNNLTISNAVGNVVSWKPSTSVSYAGYVAVQVSSLTGNNNTFVEMIFSSTIFSSGTYNADVGQPVGVSGTVVFPVLPTTNLEVKIGTSDGSAATETVTIVYFY
ncbi:MAG: hypothetical protein ABR962_06235 [Candidatus Bathyarchaeia archaeon]|jgi:hypothetical protein